MDYLKAFIIGGAICVIGQILIDKTKLTPARILVLYVVTGVFLELFGLYSRLIDFAGEGAAIPLSGFGSVLFKGIREAIDNKGLIGVLTGAISAASAGISAALVFGFIVAIIFKSKPRN